MKFHWGNCEKKFFRLFFSGHWSEEWEEKKDVWCAGGKQLQEEKKKTAIADMKPPIWMNGKTESVKKNELRGEQN